MTKVYEAVERVKVHADLIRRVRDGSGRAVADAIDAILADREEAWRVADERADKMGDLFDRAEAAEALASQQAETIKRLVRLLEPFAEIEFVGSARGSVEVFVECSDIVEARALLARLNLNGEQGEDDV